MQKRVEASVLTPASKKEENLINDKFITLKASDFKAFLSPCGHLRSIMQVSPFGWLVSV